MLRNKSFWIFLTLFVGSMVLFPPLAYCSVESTLATIQGRLITTILPLVAILGLVFAGLSFAAGSQNARS
ncbi:hypothetical protein EBR03_07365, partial [bacterium]|nr:hypothetical protein [bacterium]